MFQVKEVFIVKNTNITMLFVGWVIKMYQIVKGRNKQKYFDWTKIY